MAEVTDAFKIAYTDGPTSTPDNPDKSLIRAIGVVVDQKLAALQAEVDAVEGFAASGAKWAALGPAALATTGTITLSGEQTIDGTLTSASRVLVKNHATPALQGLYTTGAGAWTRTADADSAAEMLGLAVSVTGGTVNGGKSFICQGIAPITLGSTALPFAEMTNQSFVSASIAALDTDIDATDAKIDGLLAPVSGTQTIGVASPATGTNASNATYVHAKESEFDGVATAVQIYAGATASVEIGVFSRSTSDVFTRLRKITAGVVSGLNTIPLKLPIAQGQYMGITFVTTGAVVFISATNHGYFSGTLVGEAFTDTTTTTANELQIKFTVEQVDQPKEGSLFADTQTRPQIIGTESTPITGTNAAAGTLVLAETAQTDGIIDTISLFSAAAATVVIGIYERAGTTFTRVATIGRVTTSPGVINTFNINRQITAGQFIGFQTPTSGWTTFVSATNEGWYYNAATTGSSFVDATVETASKMQIAISIRRVETRQRHEVRLSNVDRILLLGPSYGGGFYNPKGKNWLSKVSLFSDFNIENFSFSGETIETLLDRVRSGSVSAYAAIPPSRMNLAYVLIMEGWNSANSGSFGVTLTEYQEKIRQMIETVKALGAIPILSSEWQPVYDPSAHAVFKALAEETGAMYLDLIPHSLRLAQGTAYSDFWQGPTNVRHFGVRTNHIVSDPVERYLKQLGRPANAVKLFRKRDSVTVSDINEDLMFRDAYERGERWREIYTNQVSLTVATENYYDSLTTGAGSYAVDLVTKSEYLALQNGESVAFGDYALMDMVLDAVPKNIERFQLTLSDPAVEVYVKDALVSPYPADGVSVCQWTQITGVGGVFTLLNAALPGKVHFDKLTFLLYKSGGFSITEPVIEWWGDEGKPAYPINVKQDRATGTELLAVTKFAAISGNKATGWDDEGGTITPSNVTTYQLPYDITHFVNVDATKKVVQTLTYAVDNFDDIEVEIRVTARYFPAVFASGGTYPSGAPVNQDTFDWRKVVVDLIDPTGTFVFTQTGKVGMWWDEVVFRAILPMRVNPLDIRVSGSAEIQLAQVSVKRLE